MKQIPLVTFGLPKPGRYLRQNVRLFGRHVIPIEVERETARLAMYDTANQWARGWVTDSRTHQRNYFNRPIVPLVPPRGSDQWWLIGIEDDEEYLEYE